MKILPKSRYFAKKTPALFSATFPKVPEKIILSPGPVNMSTEDAETLKLLWKPNLEIYGLQEFKKHNILSEMAGLRVSRSKRIIFDIKATIVVSCQMSFNDYPFDGHTCYFQVGSYF